MSEMIPSQYFIFIGIGILVFVLLLLVSIGQKYQAYQMQKEMTLRRMLRGVRHIEALLEQTRGAALPVELMIKLRKEVLARYVAMHQIHKNIKGIEQDISNAQRALSAAESAGKPARQAVTDRLMLNRYAAGISALMQLLQTEARFAGVSAQQKLDFLQQLADLRADYLYDFHMAEGTGLAKQEMWSEAMQHFKELMHMLQISNPSTPHVDKLFHEANLGYKRVSIKKIPGEVATPAA